MSGGDARGAVLNRVRKALGRDGAPLEDGVRARARAWLDDATPNLIPERGGGPSDERIDLFVEMAERVQSDVRRVADKKDVPAAIAKYLRERNLPQRAAIAGDPDLAACDFSTQPLLRLRVGTANDGDAVGITRALAGVAETGTLLLASSPERPTMLAYLPETCVVVIEAARVHGSYEAAWSAVGHELDAMPRSLNFVTGPSRTADIAQELQLGAHGPKRLCVVLVDGRA